MRCCPGSICLMVDLKGGFSLAALYMPAVRRHLLRLRGLQQKGLLWQSESYALSLRVQSVSQSVLRTELYSYRHTAGSLLPIPVGMLMAVSLLCTVFAFCTLMTGVRILGAAKASVINMLEPATGVVFGVILFKEKLSLKIMIGCAAYWYPP